MNRIAVLLDGKGLRPSPQRVRIYECLAGTKAHPSAEALWLALQPELPTLSRTTVYNTLAALMGAGLAKPIFIEGEEVRYDADMGSHGHFRCRSCGGIFDFPFEESEHRPRLAEGFVPELVQLSCVGLCPGCARQAREPGQG